MAKRISKASNAPAKTLLLASVEDAEITNMSWVYSAIWFLHVTARATIVTPSDPPNTMAAMTGYKKTVKIQRYNGSQWVDLTGEEEMGAIGGNVYEVTLQYKIMQGSVSEGDEIRAICKAYWQASWTEQSVGDPATVPQEP